MTGEDRARKMRLSHVYGGVLLVAGLAAAFWPIWHGYLALYGPLAIVLLIAAFASGRLGRVSAMVCGIGCSVSGAVQLADGRDAADRWGGAVLILVAIAAVGRWRTSGGAIRFVRVLTVGLVILALAAVGSSVVSLGASGSGARGRLPCGSALAPKTYTTVPASAIDASAREIDRFVAAYECESRVDGRRSLAGFGGAVALFWGVVVLASSRPRQESNLWPTA